MSATTFCASTVDGFPCRSLTGCSPLRLRAAKAIRLLCRSEFLACCAGHGDLASASHFHGNLSCSDEDRPSDSCLCLVDSCRTLAGFRYLAGFRDFSYCFSCASSYHFLSPPLWLFYFRLCRTLLAPHHENMVESSREQHKRQSQRQAARFEFYRVKERVSQHQT